MFWLIKWWTAQENMRKKMASAKALCVLYGEAVFKKQNKESFKPASFTAEKAKVSGSGECERMRRCASKMWPVRWLSTTPISPETDRQQSAMRKSFLRPKARKRRDAKRRPLFPPSAASRQNILSETRTVPFPGGSPTFVASVPEK